MAIACSVTRATGDGVLPFGDQDGADAARLAELLQRVGRGHEALRLADDDDGRGQGAGRAALAAPPVADEARQRDFDLRERDVLAARQQVGGDARLGPGSGLGRAHKVLQRRVSPAIISSASGGPHSPAS